MALIKIMEEDKNIQEDFADSLIMVTLENWEFNPSQNVLSDLVQSGRFKLISNEKLRKLLFEWTSQMLNLDNEYGFIVGIVDDHYLPYMYRNYSMKDVDRYGKLSWSRGTNLAVNKERIFRDIQFENLLDDLLYRQTNYYESLIELDTIISSIMHETIVQYD